MEVIWKTVFPNGQNVYTWGDNPLHQDNLRNLTQTIIATAGLDPIRDQGNQFVYLLKKAEVEVTDYCFSDLPHSFLIFGRISKAAQKANNIIAQDLSKILNK